MLKKLVVLGVALIMCLGLFTGCDNISLDEYKVTGKALIDAHVATKTQGDYSTDKWAELLNVAAEGRQAVEDATNKDAVDTAVEDTRKTIDEVEMERDDGLDSEIRSEIINWSYLWLELGQEEGVTLEDIDSWWIDYYYGQYSGFHVFHFRRWGFGTSIETIIDDLSFLTRGTLDIYAVKEDCGGTLKEIYENGYLTRADLEEIYEIHNNVCY